MIKVNKTIYTLEHIAPKKVIEAIESGVEVIVEEWHTDGYKTRYTQIAQVNGELFKMSRVGFKKVVRIGGGSWYADSTKYGGYQGCSFNC